MNLKGPPTLSLFWHCFNQACEFSSSGILTQLQWIKPRNVVFFLLPERLVFHLALHPDV